ncbi:MAG TPA: fused MFS/spermidine synthase [Thermoanaerobaculia bacterium]|nr:fused MFS/spermidine synthase [Thermoanaerobaculia bacterium]
MPDPPVDLAPSPERRPVTLDRVHDGAVLLLFFLSGALALVYQVAWVRALTLELGSTTLAVSTVVATFMGGLALGSAAAGRWGDRAVRPLFWYALLEAGLSVYALATPALLATLMPFAGDLASGVAERIVLLSLLRLGIASAVLLAPTALMGATLPLLARHWAGRRGDGALGMGLLYSVNTLGAFLGTLAAGFVLLPTLGLRSTIAWSGWANLLIALCAGALAALSPPLDSHAALAAPGVQPPRPGRTATLPWAVALTAFAALACQVAWTRLVTLVAGGSVYSFTVVLGTFLAGLGIGAWMAALVARSGRVEARGLFCGLALLSAALVGVSYLVALRLPGLFAVLFGRLDVADHPQRAPALQFLLAAAVLLPPALAMGGLLPAAARLRVVSPRRTAHEVSVLYVANTVGAIVGSLAGGFVLVPTIGIRGTLALAVTAQAIGALVVAVEGRLVGGRSQVPAWAAALSLVAGLALIPPWPSHLMAAGVFDKAELRQAERAGELRTRVARGTQLLYYRDGLTATVTVTRDRASRNADLYISTNGKIDGSSHLDMPTQRISAHLPILLHPDPRTVCVIGLGTGCTAGSAALHPAAVTVVEIEPAMAEGARFFAADNHGVVDDPDVDLRLTDGRLFLRLRPDQFDVLISEPSNPWLAGASDLFTREFFELARDALRERGIYGQWLQIYGLSPDTFRLLVRTFAEVFPHSYLASTLVRTDVLLIGAKAPLAVEPEGIARRMAGPVAEDLADPRVGVHDVWELLARIRLGPNEIAALAGAGPLNTDDLPRVAYRAPLERYQSTRDANWELLQRHDRGGADWLHATAGDRELLEAAWRRVLQAGRYHGADTLEVGVETPVAAPAGANDPRPDG